MFIWLDQKKKKKGRKPENNRKGEGHWYGFWRVTGMADLI